MRSAFFDQVDPARAFALPAPGYAVFRRRRLLDRLVRAWR